MKGGIHGHLASQPSLSPPSLHPSTPCPGPLPWLIPFRPLSAPVTPRHSGSVWHWHGEGAGGTQTATQMGNGQCRAASPHLLLAGMGLGQATCTRTCVCTHTHTSNKKHRCALSMELSLSIYGTFPYRQTHREQAHAHSPTDHKNRLQTHFTSIYYSSKNIT